MKFEPFDFDDEEGPEIGGAFTVRGPEDFDKLPDELKVVLLAKLIGDLGAAREAVVRLFAALSVCSGLLGSLAMGLDQALGHETDPDADEDAEPSTLRDESVEVLGALFVPAMAPARAASMLSEAEIEAGMKATAEVFADLAENGQDVPMVEGSKRALEACIEAIMTEGTKTAREAAKELGIDLEEQDGAPFIKLSDLGPQSKPENSKPGEEVSDFFGGSGKSMFGGLFDEDEDTEDN